MLAGELDPRCTVFFPPAGSQRSVERKDSLEKEEHHRQRELGHRARIRPVGAHHHDATLGSGVKIDVVDSDAVFRDHLERAGRIHHFGGKRHRPGDNRIGRRFGNRFFECFD